METTYEMTNESLAFKHPDNGRYISFNIGNNQVIISAEQEGKQVFGMRLSAFNIQLMGLFFQQQSMKINNNKG